MKLIFLFLLWFFLFCENNYRLIKEKWEEDIDLHIQNFTRRFYTKEAKLESLLKAKSAIIEESKKEEKSNFSVSNFIFIQYNSKQEKLFSLEAREGKWKSKEKKFYLKKDILFIDSKNRKIEGQEMEYDANQKVLTSQKKVFLQEGSNKGYSYCRKGIRIELKSERQFCYAPDIRSLSL